MATSVRLILLSFLFFAAVASCSAFNVTKVLGPLKQFSTFSNYLAQVGVVGMMADLKNVTILAVDNANMAPISGKSRQEIKRVMTMHVIPEYYDLERLRSLPNGTELIRTVYDLTGLARGKDGMLIVTKRGKGGRLSFASAILPRSKPTVNLLRSIVVPSRNVSIFHVSGMIVSPPPVVSVASEGAGFDAAGRIAVSGKLMVRREFPTKRVGNGGGIKLGDLSEVPMPKTLTEDGEEDIKASEKEESKGEEKAPAKSPSKSPSKDASPKKSPAKAPAPSKSSNSTSGGKKGKSPASAPSPSSDDSPAPAPSKKKNDSPSPAPSKHAPSKSPEGSKSPKAAKSSEPAPADSSSDDSPAPSKSDKGDSSSDSPASDSSPSPSGGSHSKSSPPAPASDSADADSPSDDADAPGADAPSGGAAPMSVANAGIMMTVMALWALAA